MDDRITSVTSEIEKIAEEASATFGNLTVEQLNWKPDPKSWSAAQCFDHLITINSLYFPLFEKLKSNQISSSFWEKHSPLSGFFGRYLIKTLSPEYQKKTKTSKKAYPSSSEIDGSIIERFGEHQRQLADHISNISPELVLEETIVTSPLVSFVTYNLADCITLLTVHERRHFLQAKRITEADGFPKRRP